MVSVCMASYNHEPYLRQAVDSVLAQTRSDLELVVVDDGSTDGSAELLRSLARARPAVRFLFHENRGHRGISASWNEAFRASRGQYLAWIGSDDVWYPEKLARQVALLESRPDVGLVYGLADVIDAQGARTGKVIGSDITAAPDPLEQLLQTCWIPCLTVTTRRRCLEESGPFAENLVYSDWELWIRIASEWRVAFEDRAVAAYRVHGANTSIDIPSSQDVERRLAVMSSVQARSHRQTTGLGTSTVRKWIEDELRRLQGQAAQAYFDEYYVACQAGRPLRGFTVLTRAFAHRPRELVRPRRLASLVKQFAAGSWRCFRGRCRLAAR